MIYFRTIFFLIIGSVFIPLVVSEAWYRYDYGVAMDDIKMQSYIFGLNAIDVREMIDLVSDSLNEKYNSIYSTFSGCILGVLFLVIYSIRCSFDIGGKLQLMIILTSILCVSFGAWEYCISIATSIYLLVDHYKK